MEGPDATLEWDWQDELLASLDAHSPLDTSHTLWEDTYQSEGMLETTPASEFSKEDEECLWHVEAKHGHSSELFSEDSAHTKRRRMLHFEGKGDDGAFVYNSALESSQFRYLENIQTIYDLHQNGVTQMEATSSPIKWSNDVDDDISIMGGCIDGDGLNPSPIEEEFESQRFVRQETQQELPMIIKSIAISHSKAGGKISSCKMATPVAYPFAVLKPSGMQGDVTLNDINKRIMTMQDHRRIHGINDSLIKTHPSGGDRGYTSKLLTKSVVSLTKIHTEGNGTITIMRTKN